MIDSEKAASKGKGEGKFWRALVTAGSRFVLLVYSTAIGGATCALFSLTLPFLVFVMIMSAVFAVLFD